jgi:uncharacterized Zn finger protein
MTNSKNTKKITQLFQDLYSENAAKVTSALDALQVYGNHTIIKPLFEFVQKTNNDHSRKEVIEFLSNLKDTPSKAEVMKNVHDKNFKSIQNIILSTIWNSPLDYSEFLNDFVLLAVKNDYLTSLECLTIIENLEGPFEEQAILESQLHLKDYLDGKYEKSSEKDNMISEIAILIKDFDRANQEFD